MNRMTNNNTAIFEGNVQKVMEAYSASGISIAIVEKSGNTVYEKHFGKRDEFKNLDIDGDTIFGLASITKSFTSLAIMQLHEKGIINIYHPVKEYIPEYKNKNQEPVLVWHLMNHSGGFFPQSRVLIDDIAKSLSITEEDGDVAYNEALAKKGIEILAGNLDDETSFTGKPGEYTSYSNDSFGLLTDIIRTMGGEKSYAEYINKNILNPLEMDRSTLEFAKPRDDKNTSMLYYIKNSVKHVTNDFYDNATVLLGSGAMKSTINDMKKYLHMYLNNGLGENGTSIIKEESILEMAKPKNKFGLKSLYGYGLSFEYVEDLTCIGHGGSLTGVSSHFMYSPEAEVGVIVLCNTSNVPVSLIAKSAMKLYIGLEPTMDSKYTSVSWKKEDIESASGKYISKEGNTIEISLDYNKPKVIINGEERTIETINHNALFIQDKMNKVYLEVIRKRDGSVLGVRFGSRIIPKVQ